MVDAETGHELSFDFGADYAEDLLIHHQAGGGAHHAFSLLKRLTFVPELAVEFQRRLSVLGAGYDAVHIRNTDYKTLWRQYLADIAPQLTAPALLVCSDDIQVIRFCEGYFRDRQLLSSSIPPDTRGIALHTHEFAMSREQRRQVVRDGLLDLIALANGATLRYPLTTNGHASGYSELAAQLHKNRAVVRDLLTPA
jgi:hypothetical protein